MSHRALALFTVIIFFFAGCGDHSTGPETKHQKDKISGKVNTPGNNGIEGALLTLSQGSSVKQKTFSDENGDFAFNKVKTGSYTVKLTLPQGYRKNGTTHQSINTADNRQIQFQGNPVQQDNAIVEQGKKDTVATSSGAFIALDARNSTNDIDVSITELSEQGSVIKEGTKPIKITIHPAGASKKLSESPLQRLAKSTKRKTSSAINLSFGQKIAASGPVSWAYKIATNQGPITLFAKAVREEIVDSKTNNKSDYNTHTISVSSNTNLEFTAKIKPKDNTCSKFRHLDPLPNDKTGDKALIFIHGLQTDKGSCKEFKSFKPVDLTDGDKENTFDALITKLNSDLNIDRNYKFYTYTYPTNAPIHEASDQLWHLIENNKNITNPVIIAHSMGGDVARKLLADHDNDNVKGLITLGTPHQGTPIIDKLINTTDFFKQCPAEKAPLGCAAASAEIALQAHFAPNTPGLRDLKPHSDFIEGLEKAKEDSNKIYTLGGSLGSLSAITDYANHPIIGDAKQFLEYQAIYEISFLLMRGQYKNDGMVPLSSSTPKWTKERAVLQGHDHTEMVRGEDYDKIKPYSVVKHLIPLLNKLAGDDFWGEPASINKINATPNPSNTGETVTFTADITGDEPIDCKWNFGNGDTSNKCTTTYTYQNKGTYNVSLKASNEAGSDTKMLTQKVEQGGKTNVIYVDADASGNNNGTSWGNAFNHLQDGLAKAKAGQEIWVAEGIYYPDQGESQTEGDREATFQLKDGVEIYGGFKGKETARNMRDWENNTTTLSGDVGLRDEKGDNSLHVVTGSGTDNSSIIDGFIITAGNANDYPDESGGGIYNEEGSPTIKNVLFLQNSAHDGGGGLYNNDSNPMIINVIFDGNSTNGILVGYGGGIYNRDSNPNIKNCTFKNNSVKEAGGAIYNTKNSNPSIINCVFITNSTEGDGGGIYNAKNSNPLIRKSLFKENYSGDDGGGIYIHNSSPSILNTKFFDNSADSRGGAIYIDNSKPKIVGSLFTGNSASYGGGIFDYHSESMIISSTFSKNSASNDGGGINSSYGSTGIINTIIWGNSAADEGSQIDVFSYDEGINLSYSIIQNGIPNDNEDFNDKGNNLSSNPLFIDADGPDNIPGTLDDNLYLQSGSPAIDAGLNSALDLDGDGNTTDDVPVDLDGNTRIQNGTVDIGAYETGGN